MKFAIIATVILSTILTASCGDLEDCKCFDDSHPEVNDNGEVQCVGDRVFIIRPCNIPQRPQCKCGSGVTAITNDATGTWCTENKNGEEVRRWACENEEDWSRFYAEYPSEKPKKST